MPVIGAQADNARVLFEVLPKSEASAAAPQTSKSNPAVRIRYNSELARKGLVPGALFSVPLPDGTALELQLTERRVNASNSTTIVARLANSTTGEGAVITDDGEHVYGQITTRDGTYYLQTIHGVQQLVDPEAQGMLPQATLDDGRIPKSAGYLDYSNDNSVMADSPPQAGMEYVATVDVLVGFTQSMVDYYGAAGVLTKIDQLVALTNQAYIDSGIHMRIRLLRSFYTYGYGGTAVSNPELLDLITPAEWPNSLLTDVLAELRDRYGSDLVALVRRYEDSTHQSCGNAWVLGFNEQGSLIGDDGYGYSVTSNGPDNDFFFFCADKAFPHELGHNMGSQHNRGDAGFAGVFSYSYGHGAEGEFGTIMSYISPEVNVFSNPSLDCGGQACGVAEGAPNSADNTRSINNIRMEIEDFRPRVVADATPCLGQEILVLYGLDFTSTATLEGCEILAAPQLSLLSTADLTLVAQEKVTFRPGFSVEQGASLAVRIQPVVVE